MWASRDSAAQTVTRRFDADTSPGAVTALRQLLMLFSGFWQASEQQQVTIFGQFDLLLVFWVSFQCQMVIPTFSAWHLY